MWLDIVILPPEELSRRIGEKAKEAAKGFEYELIVDNEEFLPHLSLFHINTDRIDELSESVKEVLQSHKPLEIGFREIKYLPGYFSVMIMLNGYDELYKLHKDMIETCKDVREGEMPWNRDEPPQGLDKEYREKYGSQHILKNFAPHFTVAILKKEEDVEKFSQRLRELDFTFLTERVAITEVNVHYQVTRVLKEFKFKD